MNIHVISRCYGLRPRKRRLADRIRSRMRAALKPSSRIKESSSERLIGCSFEELREKIESQWEAGMNWENYGKEGWHVDHIIPCSAYDLSDETEQKRCFNHQNLRPLWASKNIIKHDNFDEEELMLVPRELWPASLQELYINEPEE